VSYRAVSLKGTIIFELFHPDSQCVLIPPKKGCLTFEIHPLSFVAIEEFCVKVVALKTTSTSYFLNPARLSKNLADAMKF
jgi:hypothetical protein